MTNFKPLDKETWSDLQNLFGEKGACGGCWCMYWRLPHKVYENSKGKSNQLKLIDLVNKKQPLGVLAYQDEVPVGWCSISPKKDLIRFEKSRLFKTIDSQPLWSITCLFINKDHRNNGLSTRLIKAASEYAFEKGATIIEAYPIIPKTVTHVPPAFAWVGFASSFFKAGFERKTSLPKID